MSLEMPIGQGRMTSRFACFCFAAALIGGSGQSGGVIQETDEYSFDDVASQIAAEEAASEKKREK